MDKLQKKRVRKRNWIEVDERKFIHVWSKNYDELRSPRKNLLVYAEMVEELALMGIEVTVEEVRNKILNLTKKYRNQKKDYDPTCPFGWSLYKEVDAIIGAEYVDKEKVTTNVESLNKFEAIFNEELIDYDRSAQMTPVKCEPPSTPAILEAPMSSPRSDYSFPQSSNNDHTTTNPGATSTEQGIAALLTVCNRLSENVERHLLQSLAVEKQKLRELRAIRLATTKLSDGILKFMESSNSDSTNK